MSSRFRFVVEVDLERTEGKFAGRDEMEAAIQTALDDANPSQVDGIGADGMSTYEVVMWDAFEEEIPKSRPAKAQPVRLPGEKADEAEARLAPRDAPKYTGPIPKDRMTHALCDHPKTPAARSACRAARAAYLRDHPEEI